MLLTLLLFVSSRLYFYTPFVSASVSHGSAVCGIYHPPALVSYQGWADLSMTQLPLPLPNVSLNYSLIKLALLIMMA